MRNFSNIFSNITWQVRCGELCTGWAQSVIWFSIFLDVEVKLVSQRSVLNPPLRRRFWRCWRGFLEEGIKPPALRQQRTDDNSRIYAAIYPFLSSSFIYLFSWLHANFSSFNIFIHLFYQHYCYYTGTVRYPRVSSEGAVCLGSRRWLWLPEYSPMGTAASPLCPELVTGRCGSLTALSWRPWWCFFSWVTCTQPS